MGAELTGSGRGHADRHAAHAGPARAPRLTRAVRGLRPRTLGADVGERAVPRPACSPSSPRRSSSPVPCWPGCCSRGSGGTGLVARNSASLLDALPVELTDKTPAGNSRVLAADGSLITNFYTQQPHAGRRRTRSPPVMKQALVDIEDSRFYEHNGLDVQGTAARPGQQRGRRLGAGGRLDAHPAAGQADAAADGDHAARSSRRPTSADVGRKLREARLALALEQTVLQGRDPHPLPEHRVLRPGRLRHPGRRAEVLQRQRRRPHPAAGGDARRAGAEPDQRRPDHPARERRRPGATRCCSGCTRSSTSATRSWPTISAQPVAVAAGAAPPNGCIDAVRRRRSSATTSTAT